MAAETRSTGSCLCGAVRYEVRGRLRDVLTCHCTQCRRWSGHFFAAASARREHVLFVEERGLRWIASPDSDTDARRGFCGDDGLPRYSRLSGSPADPAPPAA